MQQLPNLLYRYQGFGSAHSKEALEKLFRDSELFWISPKDMNDPFDGRPSLRLPVPKDFDTYVKRIAASHMKNFTRQQRRAAKADLLSKLKAGRTENLVSSFEDFTNNMPVLCMTISKSSLLMWSHYAESHRGYCIEFEQLWDSLFYIPFKVEYHSDRPVHDLLNGDMRKDFIRVFNTKSIEWEYEHEVRFFCQHFARGYNHFPPNKLKSVYLGCNIADSDREFVISLAKKCRKDVKIFQCQTNGGSYSLDFYAIN